MAFLDTFNFRLIDMLKPIFLVITVIFSSWLLADTAEEKELTTAIDIRLKDVSIVEVSLAETTFAVQLEVNNLGDKAFEVKAMEYELSIDQTAIKKGRVDAQIAFPPGSSKNVTIRVPIALGEALFKAMSAMENPEKSEYMISGKVFLVDKAEPIIFQHQQKVVDVLNGDTG